MPNRYPITDVDPPFDILDKYWLDELLKEREYFGPSAERMWRESPKEFWDIYRGLRRKGPQKPEDMMSPVARLLRSGRG